MKKVITYDELMEKIPNKYILTIVSGERARERAKENLEKEKTTSYNSKIDRKDTEMKKVFREILSGKITYEE